MNILLFKYLIGCFVTLFIILVIAITQMPISVIRSSISFKNAIVKVLPQGWAFFTRDPRENVIWPLKEGGNGKFSSLLNVNSSSKNWFGFNRIERVILTETGELMKQIPDSAWVNREGDIDVTLPITVVKVKNNLSFPSIKGEVYFKIEKKIPWAWISIANTRKVSTPYKLAKAFVE